MVCYNKTKKFESLVVA